MRERKATDGRGKTLMRKRDYFQIKIIEALKEREREHE